MNYDAKTCAIEPDDSNNTEVHPKPMLAQLEALTNCLHSIEGKVNNIARTIFLENAEERKYTEPEDMNTEIIHDKEVALAILDTLYLFASGIGIDQ